MSDEFKIAAALERFVEMAIEDAHRRLDVLNVPVAMRAPIWSAIARRAAAMAQECEERE